MGTHVDSLKRTEEEQRALKERFQELAARWKDETLLLSNPDAMAEHPAYQEILRMGWDVVPLILADMAREPGFWFTALREITGANPISPAIRGKIRLMTEAWLQWGRDQGYPC